MSASRSPSRLPTERLADIIRVDHAGEFGAVAIYRGQLAVFGRQPGRERITAQLEQMAEQEREHLKAFDALAAQTRTRPTLLSPFWEAATALLGEKAAHACTEAVETVIGEHYQAQVDELERAGEPELSARIARFRDDELAHRDLAIEEGAREAPAYSLLSAVIGAGCRIAIRIAEKV
jgi:3-demethoxyubiquinol 3-hydroxylase